MRYYSNGEIDPKVTVAALKKVAGVGDVEVVPLQRRLRVTYTGSCKNLPSLEAATAQCAVPALVISHVHLHLQFKALSGANVGELNKQLSTCRGIKGGMALATAGEVHADIDELTFGDLEGAAQAAKFDVTLKSQRYVTVEFAKDGLELAKVEAALERTKGVLTIRSGGETVCFWAQKNVTDDQLKKSIETTGAKIEKLSK